MPSQIEKKIESLRKQIREHNHNYYVLMKPTISDREFDKLLSELETLEQDHPELITTDSPSQKVGIDLTKESKVVKHKIPMLSIQNEKDLYKFDKRIREELPKNEFVEYIVEPKIDGTSVSLSYENGELITAATRGDGEFGEDITENVKTIKSIPKKIKNNNSSPYNLSNIIVRGEIFIYLRDFENIKREQEEKGERIFVNPRNSAAGILKMKDAKSVAMRPLNNFAYTLLSTDEEFYTQEENLEILKNLGFKVNSHFKKCRNIEEVITFCEKLERVRDELPFEIDGAVIKVNSMAQQKVLPIRAKSPYWAGAFKFNPEQATTLLNNIVWQVGRTGTVTPVAELDPVFLAGSTISRATLHNYDEIKRKDIRVKDKVIIEKGGDVIPKVVSVVLNGRKKGSRKTKPPEICPSCHTPLFKSVNEVAYYCQNLECPAQLTNKLQHFVSRDALDIEAIAESVSDKLIETNLIYSPLDLFNLDIQTLASLNLGTTEEPRTFGSKNATKVVQALETAKTKPLEKWLFAIGLPKLGQVGAQAIAEKHKTFQDIINSPILNDIILLQELTEKAILVNPRSHKNPVESEQEKKERTIEYNQLCDKIDEVGKRLVRTGWYKHNEKPRSMPEYVLQNNKNVGTETPKSVQDDILLIQDISEKVKYINPTSRQNPAKTEIEKKERTAEYNQLCDRIDELGERLVRTGWYKYNEKPHVRPEYVLRINKGVGAETSRSVLNFLNSGTGAEILEKIKNLEIYPVGEIEKKGKLEGKNFVLTGTLPTLKRPEATELINQNGGKVLGTVSKNTNYLVAGDKPGSKFEDAKKFGIEIISEEQFLKMISEHQIKNVVSDQQKVIREKLDFKR